MSPKQVKIYKKDKLKITWENSTETILSLKYMRNECPCAGCKGETILLKTYRPPAPTVVTPEMYQVKDIEVVGGYAIQITWMDEHNTGIYSWDYIKQLEEGMDENKNQDYKPII